MSDFNWDDYEGQDDDLFGGNEREDDDRLEVLRKAQRLMFINDLEKQPSQPMPVSIEEFIHLFGLPSDEDIEIMTQLFLKDYMKYMKLETADYAHLCSKWGLDWLDFFRKFNEETEEYELCAVLKEVIEGGRDVIKEWMAEMESK